MIIHLFSFWFYLFTFQWQSYKMWRFKHSRLRYRKCYFLLSALSISLIIYYCLISRKQNFMLLTFFQNNNNYESNNNKYNIGDNNIRSSSISKNILNKISTNNNEKKHVVESNKQLRDWHKSQQIQTLPIPLFAIQVTRDHTQFSTTTTSFGINKKQQQINVHELQQRPETILSLPKSKNFGQTDISNSTYMLKLIENTKVKNTNKNSNNIEHDYTKKSSQLTGFNIELSESLPLQRLIPDTRHKR